MDVHPTKNVSIGVDPYPYGPICINDSGEPGDLAARPGDSEPTAPGISVGEPYAGHFRREPGAKVPWEDGG